MICPRILRKLDLDTSIGTVGPRHLAAGSGLVAVGGFVYVVADDELHLGCFLRSGDAAGTLVRLFDVDTPSPHAHYLCWNTGVMDRWECSAFLEWLQKAMS